MIEDVSFSGLRMFHFKKRLVMEQLAARQALSP
jgi:hypothetical protein